MLFSCRNDYRRFPIYYIFRKDGGCNIYAIKYRKMKFGSNISSSVDYFDVYSQPIV